MALVPDAPPPCAVPKARTRPLASSGGGTEGAEHAWRRWWRSTSAGEACAGASTPGRGSDAGRGGRGRSDRPPGQPPGHDRRLDHPGVHERGGVPYGSVLAEHGRVRAGPAPGRGVPVPGVRATERPGRPSARPGACAAQPRGGRRGQARLVRGGPRTAVGPVLHGRHRGLLGARRRAGASRRRRRLPQPRASTAPTSSTSCCSMPTASRSGSSAAARDDPFAQVVEHDNDRAWRVVLESCRGPNGKAGTVLDAARAMGDEGLEGGGSGPGIETLVVMLGANNALGHSGPPRRAVDAAGLPRRGAHAAPRQQGCLQRVAASAFRRRMGAAGRGTEVDRTPGTSSSRPCRR